MNDDIPLCAFCLKGPDLVDILMNDDPQIGELEPMKLTQDVLGNYWCEDHQHIKKVMNWGSRHGWPHLDLKNGTVGIVDEKEVAVIPAGAHWWHMCLVANSNIEIGYLAEGAIDFLDSQEQEQAS